MLEVGFSYYTFCQDIFSSFLSWPAVSFPFAPFFIGRPGPFSKAWKNEALRLPDDLKGEKQEGDNRILMVLSLLFILLMLSVFSLRNGLFSPFLWKAGNKNVILF